MEKCYEIAIFDNGYNVLKTYEFGTIEDVQKQLKDFVEKRLGFIEDRDSFRYVELSVIYIEYGEQLTSFKIADIDLLALEM